MSDPTFTPSAEFQVASDGPRDVGIVFVGASLVAGVGDPKGQGWVSRVVGRTHSADLELTAYNLGVRGDTTADVLARWKSECAPRWQGRADEDEADVAGPVGRDLELGARGEGGLAHASVLVVVEPGQPGGQALDGGLEIGIQVHEGPQLVGQPLEGDLFFPSASDQLLDAAIREVHDCKVNGGMPRG